MVAKTTDGAHTVEPEALHRLSPRDRLLAAADELFYAEGVHVVGIDRIVERAGVAKASLYSIFGSKDGAAVAARMDMDRGGAASALISAVASLLDAAIPPEERSKRR